MNTRWIVLDDEYWINFSALMLDTRYGRREAVHCEYWYQGEKYKEAIAICNPTDNYDPYIGRLLALYRVLDKVYGKDNLDAWKPFIEAYYEEFGYEPELVERVWNEFI